jgi:twitching motility protein PilJ
MNQAFPPDPQSSYTSDDPLPPPKSEGIPEVNELLRQRQGSRRDNSSKALSPLPNTPHLVNNDEPKTSDREVIRRYRGAVVANQQNEPTTTAPLGTPTTSNPEWGLSTKVMLGFISLAIVPLLLMGIGGYLAGQSLKKEVPTPLANKVIDSYNTRLLLGTATFAVASGAIAAFIAGRATKPILKAVRASNTLVNRLRREEIAPRSRVDGRDELAALENNLQIMTEQIPRLLSHQEHEAERMQLLMGISRRVRESFSQEEVLRIAVHEIRGVLRTDRVAFFRFDSAEDGTIVEESVAPGWPKMLWTTLTDPCLADYLERYRQGRVQVVDDIHNSGLNDCHIGLLDRFSVKANLVAPIFKDKALFGLLITSQCSGPRFWQQSEVDLFRQLAAQVGYALDRARLMEQVDARASQAYAFIEIARRIRASLNPEDILQTTVDEVRKVLLTDRVIIYSFDAQWYGTVVAESIVPGLPKALWANIHDPCFAESYVEQYQKGRVQAIPDIYEAGLTECHLKQLEPFSVRANLVAPILKDSHLFALLIAHECSKPRNWQQSEVDFFAQLATQVGFALDHARVLAEVEARGEQAQVFVDISQQIREYLNEEDILTTTVNQLRKAIRADRVVVYNFNEDWSGFIAAESVLPGFPHARDYKIEDACIPQDIRDAYVAGRVQPTCSFYEAGSHPDYERLIERLKIQAILVVPILNHGKLFGLLIAHQCSGPRDWQPSEIDLFLQVALQVGFALEHARLLDQVEQAYQSAEAASIGQRRQFDTLQSQVSNWLQNSEPVMKALAAGMMQQMEGVTSAYQHLKALSSSAQQTLATLSRQQVQHRNSQTLLEQGNTAIEALRQNFSALQNNSVLYAQTMQQLGAPTQAVLSLAQQMTQLASQMKLQAMNAALEATRRGDAAQEFATIGEKVLELARQLDHKTTELSDTASLLQTKLATTTDVLRDEAPHLQAGVQGLEQTADILSQFSQTQSQLQDWFTEIMAIAQSQSSASATANQMIVEVAALSNQATEQAMTISSTLEQLTTLAHEQSTLSDANGS